MSGDHGSGTVGFNLPKVKALAGRMDAAAPGAHHLHTQLAQVLLDAHTDLAGDAATTDPHLLQILQSYGTGRSGGLPGRLNRELTETAASMRRRCTQMEGLNKLKLAGWPVDPSMAFLDEKPPDPKKIEKALEAIRHHEGQYAPQDAGPQLPFGGRNVYNDLHGLTGAELDLVLKKLTPADYLAIKGQVTGNHIDANLRMDLGSLIMGRATGPAAARALKQLPMLQPATAAGAHYTLVTGPLFGAGNPALDLAQREADDCWALAGVGAVAQTDPTFLQQHIHTNDNGSYTVTLYQGGHPVQVTVDGQLPENGDGTLYDYPGVSGQRVLWPAIYEKALAQLHGGYPQLKASTGAAGLESASGSAARTRSPGDVSLAHLQDLLDRGHAITTGSVRDPSTFTSVLNALGLEDLPHTMDGGRIARSHGYIVTGVHADGHPPIVTMINPWGRKVILNHKVVPQTVTLTQDQWRTYFNEVADVPGGRR
ncbi:hypothetical protein BIV57_00565 [Mangrovactinospora gilvigrisea]|uniref:Calpain catalytic domain-containing protein n=1 Tax=Mangrovactinospora gilvigrisea TaxID=1428644 RepID=A0A1J7CCU5_9ACTN|nr:C2 family cysteine protease [Mangrovactinospora gilvigrisea]OIV39372.1 hypothetical protein BIV57_00565 [Mangrovactinospora gilvigrisea]